MADKDSVYCVPQMFSTATWMANEECGIGGSLSFTLEEGSLHAITLGLGLGDSFSIMQSGWVLLYNGRPVISYIGTQATVVAWPNSRHSFFQESPPSSLRYR